MTGGRKAAHSTLTESLGRTFRTRIRKLLIEWIYFLQCTLDRYVIGIPGNMPLRLALFRSIEFLNVRTMISLHLYRTLPGLTVVPLIGAP